ncbi:MAG: hypothetical protein V4443_06515 [Pseudomonadota bacterium]
MNEQNISTTGKNPAQVANEHISATRKNIDQVAKQKLFGIVKTAIAEMAAATRLTPDQALGVLQSVNVEMIDDLDEAIKNSGITAAVNKEKLSEEIEKVIKTIAHETTLHTDTITSILSQKRGASLEEVVATLQEKGIAPDGMIE